MTREILPQRRKSITFDLEWPKTAFNPKPVTVNVGFYEDGRIGEIFISAGKSGEQLEAATRDGSIILSLALQYGAQIDAIRHSITRDETGEALSMLGAIIDAVAVEVATTKKEGSNP